MPTQEEMTILLKARDQAKAVLTKSQAQLEKYKGAIKAVGIGMIAAGAAVEALARKQAPLLEATKKLANETGFTEKEVRKMAISLSNATFPLEMVLSVMEQGAKQGIKNGEALKKYAAFWDMVGDATGESAAELARAGKALEAVGISTGEESELLEAFGLVTTQTSGNVREFLTFVERLAPELRELGANVNDAAVVMTALEQEMGLAGRTGRQVFREAVNEVNKTIREAEKLFNDAQVTLGELGKEYEAGSISLAEYNAGVADAEMRMDTARVVQEKYSDGINSVAMELGLTSEQLDKYRGSLQGSAGIIAANADAFGSTKTRLEELQSSLGDVLFTMGPFIQQAASIAPVMLVAGPIMAAFGPITSTAMTIASVATRVFGLAIKTAMGPAGLVILAIGAAIAIGVLLWKNWDTIKEKAIAIFGFIKAFFVDVWDGIVGIFKRSWKLVIGILFPPVGIALLIKANWGRIVGFVTDIWDQVKQVVQGAIDFIMGKINLVLGAISRVKGAVRAVGGFLGKINPFAEGGPISAGQVALVGEKGPELFTSRTSGTIIPNSVLGRGGATGGITIIGPLIQAETIVGGDLEDLLEQALDNISRRTGKTILAGT